MIQKIKRPLSILLVMLMVVSVFVVAPVTASAKDNGKTIAVGANDAPTYTITWKNGDGSVLKTETVEENVTPSYSGTTPTKADDDNYSYTFSGWTPAPSAAQADATYTPTFTQGPKRTTAEYVKNAIDALPEEVTLADKDAVAAARTAYNALSNAEKAKVDANTLKKLTDAEAMVANLEVAAPVAEQINALPDKVTPENKAEVEAARAAFDALTPGQQDAVGEAAVNKLAAAEKSIADQEAAAPVAEQLNALPENAVVADKDAVKAAREAYDALTADQKALIDTDTLAKLTNAEKAIADQEAAAPVAEQINALPEDVTLENKADVDAARAAYDALTDDQKALIDADTLSKLTDAEKVVNDSAAVAAVEEQINALTPVSKMTADDRAAIDAAKDAFDALTDEQKELVSTRSKAKLAAAVIAIVAVEKNAADHAAADPVAEMIQALPAPGNITAADKAAVDAASDAYDALTDDQKALISLADKTKLTAVKGAADAAVKIADDEAAADAVEDMIAALPAAKDITAADKDAVEEAQAAYEALTDNQKKLVTLINRIKLSAVSGALTAAVNEAAADAVEDMITALPAANRVTVDDKAAIEEAKAAYDALTPDQKKLVTLVNRMKLSNVTDALAAAEDEAAADAVEKMIDRLPAASKVTVKDKPAIEETKAAYDALTDDRKKLITIGNRAKLAAVVGALAGAEDEAAADAVEKMIAALPAAAAVTIDDKAAVEEAKAAYDALTSGQKKLVTLVNRTKLTADLAAIAKLENDIAAADAVKEMIAALPAAADVTFDDATALWRARNAYETLTDAQKALVDEDSLAKLTDAEQALGELVDMAAVQNLLNALPDAEDVTINDKANIELTRNAYEALSDAQKAMLDEASVQNLADAEAAIAKIEDDMEAALDVTILINALPSARNITTDDRAAFDEVAAAYDALTDDQKAYVPFVEKAKLALVKTALEAAEKAAADEAAADEVDALIDALPAPDEVTLDDKAAVEEAVAAYEALTPDQKKLVNLGNRMKLALDNAVIEKIENDIAAAEAVTEMINALPAAEDVTLDDAEAIAVAADAYDNLTDDQKALVADETVDKLNAAEEALGKLNQVEVVKSLIDALPEAVSVSIKDKDYIESVREAYEALDDAQKALIDDETLSRLTDAEEALLAIEEDIAAAEAVSEMIQALPSPADVTVDDKEAIDEAVKAYNGLTDAQKDYVSLRDLAKLAFDQAALAAAEKAAADEAAAAAVADMIEALPLPTQITVDDKAAVEEARDAYNALTDDQKALVSASDKVKLVFDQLALAKAENDKAAADAVAEQINALPAVEDLTPEDADAVQAARDAYDALTKDQKELIDEDTYKKLTDAEERLSRFVLLGDANGDGMVNVRDVTAIQRFLVEASQLDELGQLAADVDRDGTVTINDATVLQAYLAEYAVEYPIGTVV